MNREMKLIHYGEIVQKWWDELQNHFQNVETGAFIVMPNHIHGIIMITDCRGAVLAPRDNSNFKILETPEIDNELMKQKKFMKKDGGINQGGETPPLCAPTLGQIYEHIIRSEHDLQNKTDYIESNPMLWDEDDMNPININS